MLHQIHSVLFVLVIYFLGSGMGVVFPCHRFIQRPLATFTAISCLGYPSTVHTLKLREREYLKCKNKIKNTWICKSPLKYLINFVSNKHLDAVLVCWVEVYFLGPHLREVCKCFSPCYIINCCAYKTRSTIRNNNFDRFIR